LLPSWFGEGILNKSLQKLISLASKVQMNPHQVEEQRRSFAYGSAKIENDRITRQMVDEAAEKLKTRTRD
jgi:hypothetical protein